MALNADTENVADPAISQSITEALRVSELESKQANYFNSTFVKFPLAFV